MNARAFLRRARRRFRRKGHDRESARLLALSALDHETIPLRWFVWSPMRLTSRPFVFAAAQQRYRERLLDKSGHIDSTPEERAALTDAMLESAAIRDTAGTA